MFSQLVVTYKHLRVFTFVRDGQCYFQLSKFVSRQW